MESYNKRSFVTELLPLTQCFQGSSTLSHVSVLCSFLLLTHTLLHGYSIYSSIDGHVGCLHFLVIMNSAATNILVKVLCGRKFLVLMHICTLEWNCWVISQLYVYNLKTGQLLFTAVTPFCILTSSIGGFQFPRFFTNTCYCLSFWL